MKNLENTRATWIDSFAISIHAVWTLIRLGDSQAKKCLRRHFGLASTSQRFSLQQDGSSVLIQWLHAVKPFLVSGNSLPFLPPGPMAPWSYPPHGTDIANVGLLLSLSQMLFEHLKDSDCFLFTILQAPSRVGNTYLVLRRHILASVHSLTHARWRGGGLSLCRPRLEQSPSCLLIATVEEQSSAIGIT